MSVEPITKPGRRLNLHSNPVFGVVFAAVFFAIVASAWKHLPRFDPPIYFEFADRREWFGIRNSMDVVSNFAFLWVGIFWWRRLGKIDGSRTGWKMHLPVYRFIAVASVLTGLGSIWFHWNPNVETLFWDRLPMTLGFSGMIGLLVADRFEESFGRKLTIILAVVAVAHLILWNVGLSDLRPYIVLQYGGVLLAASLLFVRWKSGSLRSEIVFAAVLLYAAAKVTEAKDLPIFAMTGFISGHTVKHLLAAMAIDRLFVAGSAQS